LAKLALKRRAACSFGRTKGWRMPANTVRVDWTTLFGNLFSVEGFGHDRAVALRPAWLTGKSIGNGYRRKLWKGVRVSRRPCRQCAATT